MGMIWAEVWTRPGNPTFGRIVADPGFLSHGLSDGLYGVGSGNASLPDSFTRFDDILSVDPLDPANSKSSLIRCFSDDDPTTPIYEWIPHQLIPVSSKDDPTVELSGRSIKSILEYARTEPWDWDGTDSFVSTFGDWIYGGRNLIRNPSFEEQVCSPTIYELVVTATGGTYTLTDGVNVTAPIAWNANAVTVEDRLEADISSIDDVLVSGTGSADDPFIIQFVVPCFGPSLTIDTTNLTGGSADLVETVAGGYDPTPWTRSRGVSRGVPISFGVYTQFTVTTAAAQSGTSSLLIDPKPIVNWWDRYAGVQQVVAVQPGGRYQASVWIRPTSASDVFRFVLRGIDEDLIAFTEGSFPANTWSQMSLGDVDVGDNSQIIFRVANINNPALGDPVNPSPFYVDTAELAEGFAPASVGRILRDLYEDATLNHAPGRVVWDDGTGNPYLTLDFTDTLDSSGQPWDDPALTVKIWVRMSLLDVVRQFEDARGYEFRVVPDIVEGGTWLLQAFNPSGMGTDYTAAASPAIQGGSSDTRRSIRRFLPLTDHLVEGERRLTARARSVSLISALGRRESSVLDRELVDLTNVAAAAGVLSASAVQQGLSWVYTLGDPAVVPLAGYRVGDRLVVHDPPEVDNQARLVGVTGSFSPDSDEWEVELIPLLGDPPSRL